MKYQSFRDLSLSGASQALNQWTIGRPTGPLKIEFYPTNRCNIQCRICWQRLNNYDKTYASELSDERCLRLVDEAAEFGKVNWVIKGGGEPMARGKLVMQMVRRIIERGMNGQIYTNGTLFKPDQLEELVKLGWSSLSFSLDGPTKDINDEIRTGGFEKACKNLRLLQEFKEKKNSLYPTVAMNTVMTNRIVEKLDEVITFAHEYGISQVYFSGLIRFTENCDSYQLNDAEVRHLRLNAQNVMDYAEKLGITHNLDELINPDLWSLPNNRCFKTESPGNMGVNNSFCFKPYTELVIFQDGQVGPCCMSYDDKADNVKDKTLREIWEDGYMSRVREHFEHSRPMPYCSHCPTSLYAENIKLRELMEKTRPSVWAHVIHAIHCGVHGVRRKGIKWALRGCGRLAKSTWRLYRC